MRPTQTRESFALEYRTEGRTMHGRRDEGKETMQRGERVVMELSPQAVEQVARRVAQLLHRQQENQQHAETGEPVGMVTVAEFAAYYKLSPAWVYEHSDELEATRIGSGPKARIRLDFQTAKAALARLNASSEPAASTAPTRKHRRPRPSPYEADAPLLESRPREILGVGRRAASRAGAMRSS